MEDLSFKVVNFSDDILSEMGVNQMRTLLIDARDAFSSAAPTPFIFVQLSVLFISPLPLPLPTLTSYVTPKMNRVRSVTPYD